MSRALLGSYFGQLLTVFDVRQNRSQYPGVTSCEARSRCDVKGHVSAPHPERIWDVLVVGVLLVAAAFGFVWSLPH